jgi:hypothetical protein
MKHGVLRITLGRIACQSGHFSFGDGYTCCTLRSRSRCTWLVECTVLSTLLRTLQVKPDQVIPWIPRCVIILVGLYIYGMVINTTETEHALAPKPHRSSRSSGMMRGWRTRIKVATPFPPGNSLLIYALAGYSWRVRINTAPSYTYYVAVC